MRKQTMLDFVEYCIGPASPEAKIERFRQAISAFDLDAAVAGGWVGVGGSRAYRFYFNDWPQSWRDIYTQRNFFPHDPFAAQTRRTMEPYRWTDLRLDPAFRSGISGEIDAAVVAYGWTEVIGIPVHGPSGYQGLVSLGALRPCRIDDLDLHLLRAMALAIHDVCHDELGFGLSTRPAPKLSDRELDCMRWVAAGKTDAEIAIILGISASTAHFHVERVKKKLGLRSRTEAVGLLVLEGIL